MLPPNEKVEWKLLTLYKVLGFLGCFHAAASEYEGGDTTSCRPIHNFIPILSKSFQTSSTVARSIKGASKSNVLDYGVQPCIRQHRLRQAPPYRKNDR